MTKLKHYDNLSSARFITFSCYNRYQLLNDNKPRDIFLKYLQEICSKYKIDILGYVLMPEHVHLVILPQENIPIGRVVGELKSKSAREILMLFRKQKNTLLNKLTVNDRTMFWQKRCYNHNCRTEETVREKINYCHKNPVNRGLVKSMEDWKYSSYRWYKGMDGVVVEIDGIQL